MGSESNWPVRFLFVWFFFFICKLKEQTKSLTSAVHAKRLQNVYQTEPILTFEGKRKKNPFNLLFHLLSYKQFRFLDNTLMQVVFFVCNNSIKDFS